MLSDKIARGSRTVVQDWAFTSIIIEITRVFQAAAAGCILLLCIRRERSVVNDYVFEQTEGADMYVPAALIMMIEPSINSGRLKL